MIRPPESYTLHTMNSLGRNLLLVAVLAPASVSFGACGSSEGNSTQFVPGNLGGSAGTGADAQPEAQPEAGPDAIPEAGPEAAEDVDLPEAGPEPQPESGPKDAGKDAPLEAGPTWPDCKSKPSAATDMTMSAIWATNPSSDTYVWLSGVYVSAISKGGCAAGTACQIYLQDQETYSSWAASAHHGIKLLIYANAAEEFVGLKVGDKVDVAGQAGRPQSELLIRVGKQNLPGCARATGLGVPSPVTGVALADLTVDAYEKTHGPVLLQLANVTGKPGDSFDIFGIWNTGTYNDAGPEGMVSASPYFLPGGGFTGLSYDGGTQVKFSSITGVFGLFTPSGDAGAAVKYLVVYPRNMNEVVLAP